MFNLYFFLTGLTLFIAFASLCYLIDYYYYRKKHGKKVNKDMCKRKFLVIFNVLAILFTVFYSAPFQALIKLDSIYFKPPGEYCYNVKALDCKTNKEAIFPARISVDEERDRKDNFFGSIFANFTIHFYLEDLYTDFDSLIVNNEHELTNEVFVNKPVLMYCEEYDKDFKITLLNERAYLSNNEKYQKVKMNNGIKPISVIIDIIVLLITSTYLVLYFYQTSLIKKENKSQ